MTSYNPTNMAQVHTALARIAADVAVEGLPLPELLWAICERYANGLTACASSSSLVTSWCE